VPLICCIAAPARGGKPTILDARYGGVPFASDHGAPRHKLLESD
jgi:hypothetical protein